VALAVFAVAPWAAANDQKTLIPRLRLGGEASFEIYGQIDKGFLVYDDGGGALLYPLVDNSNSSARFGAKVGAPVASDVDWRRLRGRFRVRVDALRLEHRKSCESRRPKIRDPRGGPA